MNVLIINFIDCGKQESPFARIFHFLWRHERHLINIHLLSPNGIDRKGLFIWIYIYTIEDIRFIIESYYRYACNSSILLYLAKFLFIGFSFQDRSTNKFLLPSGMLILKIVLI